MKGPEAEMRRAAQLFLSGAEFQGGPIREQRPQLA
eukprot:CAMPEP_0180815738 /NCGR_PEP_ID=MMETSP1038_2-20121128/67785_1 /TAXON_ID=632150 /ORGANISM="Azadinium spinosum, Strain 3D9" /LENGTH=34 /DNA_ID= /DNA_START= /DNA_END= /DNA_ORIENTATION=